MPEGNGGAHEVRCSTSRFPTFRKARMVVSKCKVWMFTNDLLVTIFLQGIRRRSDGKIGRAFCACGRYDELAVTLASRRDVVGYWANGGVGGAAAQIGKWRGARVLGVKQPRGNASGVAVFDEFWLLKNEPPG
jgi:hypothetical protein